MARANTKGNFPERSDAGQRNHDLVQDEVDKKLNIVRIDRSNARASARCAFLCNLKTTKVVDEEGEERSALLLYFIEQNGGWFKAYLRHDPYFYISCREEINKEMVTHLEKRFEGRVSSVHFMQKIDLELANHLAGIKSTYIRLSFKTISDLMHVRNEIKARMEKNRASEREYNDYEELYTSERKYADLLDAVIDMREYDIPYHTRVCIDREIRISMWYNVTFKNDFVEEIRVVTEMTERPEFRIMAYDIETSKQPLKFPDSKIDNVVMISICVDSEAILITNRTIVGSDVENFEYVPRAEFEAKVKVYNEANERALLERFYQLIIEMRPFIITTFNGDKFDWPFIEARSLANGLSMESEIGVKKGDEEEYYGRFITHLDCFCWVERDSYLPHGSHGLKAVTKSKLGYDPVEVDPEEMMPMAKYNSQKLGEYAISDAVATYYLYKRHIHDFIFALGTILPMNPDEVLRKGSGTLCESLLMAAAFKGNIIFPNKKKERLDRFYQGHLIESETYIGGHVECLTSGVFRSDITTSFSLDRTAFKELIEGVEKTLKFTCEVELKENFEDVINKEEAALQIIEKLEKFAKIEWTYDSLPLVYHLDVAAMYPNIILTNRLQPVAIVNDNKCSSCIFNSVTNNCKRNLSWQLKVDYFPITRSDYAEILGQIEHEYIMKHKNENVKRFFDTPIEEHQVAIKKRVKLYSEKNYKRVHESKIELKTDTVCMRENPFYVDTVRAFRDRRYEYKTKVKIHKNRSEEFAKNGQKLKAQDEKELVNLYESLQLAHKVILNSFYGYVMRRGARWYSMEMAAMVTHTGSAIISRAKSFIDRIGKPLELDTDGIWCLFPKGFPENVELKLKNGGSLKFSYPCSILNLLIHDEFSNPQYQELRNEGSLEYESRKEMSIFFEIDGPYKAMIIPAAREEGKLLKKRYAVYNLNNTLAEVKGFEIKRRGELKIIKIFQSQIFSEFLKGSSLEECYEACGLVAEKWLNILYNKCEGLRDEELFDYLLESRVLSKSLSEYEAQKGVAITSAKRMAEFLGDDIVQGKGLNCSFVISQKPMGSPVNERAIPISIFSAEETVKIRFLKKWLKENDIPRDINVRQIIDWSYYIERLGNTIQKIVMIPAAFQKVRNPVKSLSYPEWLSKLVKENESKLEQKTIRNFFQKKNAVMDIEDLGGKETPLKARKATPMKTPASKERNSQSQRKVTESAQKENKMLKIPNPHSHSTEFRKWLKWEKEKWKKSYSGGDVKRMKTASAGGIRSLFQSQEQYVLSNTWHILQLHETESKGVFKVWVYLENKQVFAVRVNIPRIIYINTKENKQNDEIFKSVKKKLPREKAVFNLYEARLNENDFIQKYKSLEYFFTNPDIEGVYETKMPLTFRFISSIGCLARVHRPDVPKNASYSNFTFNFETLTGQLDYDKPYLVDFDLPRIYLEQIIIKDKTVWAVFNPIQAEYEFVLIHKNNDPTNYSVIVKEVLRQDEEFSLHEKPRIKTHNLNTAEAGFHFVERKIQSIKQTARTPFIVVCRSKYSIEKLNLFGLKSLGNEVPTLVLPLVKTEEVKYSALDWQKKAIRFICENYLALSSNINSLIDFCRYGQLPLCNVEEDKYIFMTDVFFSRVLKKNNYVSWFSDGFHPDLGGADDDDYRSLVPTENSNIEIAKPGMYYSYCVEYDLNLLVFNTIDVSDELKNIDKEVYELVEARASDKSADTMEELALSKNAFKSVKFMVGTWFRDVMSTDNPIADKLIQNINRWISFEGSRLYDQNLKKMLRKLTRRVFSYLLSKLRSLGAKIVFGNPNRLIICTEKDTTEKATEYSEYILKTLISYPLFNHLNFEPFRVWKILAFKDNYNYAGLDCEERVIQHWNILAYMPPIVQGVVENIVNENLLAIKRFKDEFYSSSEATIAASALNLQNKLIEHCKNFVKNKVLHLLLELIPQFIHKLNKFRNEANEAIEDEEMILEDSYREQDGADQDDVYSVQSYRDDDFDEEETNKRRKRKEKEKKEIAQWEFPIVQGRALEYANQVLELINFTHHILSLDENLRDELIILRRTCLRKINLSDFSEHSLYKEPVRRLILTDVICDNEDCFNVSEFDLFRDRQSFSAPFQFLCVCGKPFEKRYIEDKIMSFLKNNIALHQIQDVYCCKCKLVKDEHLMRFCKCSGKFQTNITDFSNPLTYNYNKRLLESIKEIAQNHGMDILAGLLNNLTLA